MDGLVYMSRVPTGALVGALWRRKFHWCQGTGHVGVNIPDVFERSGDVISIMFQESVSGCSCITWETKSPEASGPVMH